MYIKLIIDAITSQRYHVITEHKTGETYEGAIEKLEQNPDPLLP